MCGPTPTCINTHPGTRKTLKLHKRTFLSNFIQHALILPGSARCYEMIITVRCFQCSQVFRYGEDLLFVTQESFSIRVISALSAFTGNRLLFLPPVQPIRNTPAHISRKIRPLFNTCILAGSFFSAILYLMWCSSSQSAKYVVGTLESFTSSDLNLFLEILFPVYNILLRDYTCKKKHI